MIRFAGLWSKELDVLCNKNIDSWTYISDFDEFVPIGILCQWSSLLNIQMKNEYFSPLFTVQIRDCCVSTYLYATFLYAFENIFVFICIC